MPLFLKKAWLFIMAACKKKIARAGNPKVRITGKHRLYGFMRGAVFNVLWYDLDHGDNDTCVCRSRKKHT